MTEGCTTNCVVLWPIVALHGYNDPLVHDLVKNYNWTM